MPGIFVLERTMSFNSFSCADPCIYKLIRWYSFIKLYINRNPFDIFCRIIKVVMPCRLNTQYRKEKFRYWNCVQINQISIRICTFLVLCKPRNNAMCSENKSLVIAASTQKCSNRQCILHHVLPTTPFYLYLRTYQYKIMQTP